MITECYREDKSDHYFFLPFKTICSLLDARIINSKYIHITRPHVTWSMISTPSFISLFLTSLTLVFSWNKSLPVPQMHHALHLQKCCFYCLENSLPVSPSFPPSILASFHLSCRSLLKYHLSGPPDPIYQFNCILFFPYHDTYQLHHTQWLHVWWWFSLAWVLGFWG